MKILLVTHKFQKIVGNYCSRTMDVVNESELVLEVFWSFCKTSILL